MSGHRMSLLPLTVFCGQAGELSRQYGAGRPAAMSQSFHATAAKAPNALELFARLSDVERAEIATWKPVADVEMTWQGHGWVLRYSEAEKELAIGLDEYGQYCDPESPDCLTVGHLDMAWRTPRPDSVAYVGDIKKSVWTTADGPESLQLHAYGWAYARKHGCESYCTGLWCATEGEWLWSKEIVTLASERGQQIWERIYAASSRTSSEASTGSHCRSCWSRLHCPEYTLPAVLQSTELAPAATGMVPSGPEAAVFLQRLQTLEELIDLAKKNLQEAVRRGALRIEDENGKVYGPVEMKGRESVDVKALKEKLGDGASQFLKKGAPYTQFRWLNARSAP